MRQLRESLLEELNSKNMLETIGTFNHLFRYSGTAEGEAAVSYLEEKLSEYGIPFEHCEYDGFFSLPVRAFAKVDGVEYPLVGDVYSAEADSLQGTLYYDSLSEEKGLTKNQEKDRFESFRDKIVLTWESKGVFVRRAMEAGAKAVLHICATKGDYIHHSNIGMIWGTPDFDEAAYMKFLPSAGIRRADGEALIEKMAAGEMDAEVTIEMETKIRRSSMVAVDIKGKSDSFVLVSGHYDSWYEGITDNAVSDAILLEYARVLYAHRSELKRGVRIAWWSGHSDGRFSGSTWYCDSHYADLRKNCVAHVNLDLTGCKNSEQIVARTAGSEGISYTADLIEKYTGKRPDVYIPMIRGADQSFWGAYVPITIMLKYEPLPEKRLSDCPSGGPWWHTPKDTIDKLDEKIMMRDAKINMEMLDDIQSAKMIPVNIPVFLEDLDGRLKKTLSGLAPEFDTTEICAKDDKKFMIGIVSRLTNQKGLDLIQCVMDEICTDDVQLVVLGTGDENYENMFRHYDWKYHDRVSAQIYYSEPLSHKIYAACDAFLMPSLFEPCGLSQLMALRYGTVPIVRETGGLKDTVWPYNEFEGTGTGFSFANYNAHEMLNIIRYAKHIYYDKKREWNKIVDRAMAVDFSWKTSAGKYQELYDWLIGY